MPGQCVFFDDRNPGSGTFCLNIMTLKNGYTGKEKKGKGEKRRPFPETYQPTWSTPGWVWPPRTHPGRATRHERKKGERKKKLLPLTLSAMSASAAAGEDKEREKGGKKKRKKGKRKDRESSEGDGRLGPGLDLYRRSGIIGMNRGR